jgi:ATP-binding cassette, subfamily B, bacterial
VQPFHCIAFEHVKLLWRLYDPTDGVISIARTCASLTHVCFDKTLQSYSEDYVRYCATVRDNIWFGSVNLPREDERVQEAARSAGAEEFIQSLDQGLRNEPGHDV